MRLAWCAAVLACIVGSWCASKSAANGQEPAASSQPPLHDRINALIDAASGQTFENTAPIFNTADSS